MFREIRRKKNELSREEAVEILKTQPHGTLAVDGDDNYPYAVPLSYVYTEDDKIVFHCANFGHKLDSILKNDKVSFCVIAQDNIVPAEFNTLYKSAVAFGRARILKDENEKNKGLEAIIKKYSPDYLESGNDYIKKEWNNVTVVEMRIEYLTAKAGD